ncbi:MAG: bifunctional N(6)-L-threonylcarbamoyladenine synthase/serine/threonine protein kinase [Methanocellales archaeon]|nr:bifunctional N(6)-L-threonylcarbamoyladenine synthase/serine/threonine protein kinase [Methanocellales archaeon]MDD3292306.1 bifunctional N(6)-L-threonylcarbamoyladenine synthase/serine/threonine protein kinase [Methanocellales archaeon]MDD5235584.1 bifunctional N(6)-L-threonylcarbamoyladenine synthase/serine/threonine protein kinase [Methanocellales archaeon]MDD5485769.1 bifunctional N(6)-L-threonylcarbamoyladenine synthase/serine/threonine protein kinase [Methanocellales archaeon]
MKNRFVLGIEGTAWNLSAAIVDRTNIVAEAESQYLPQKGGLHPRMAAQHHASNIGDLIKKVLAEGAGKDLSAVAFSQGPGFGPCLRTIATAARALSLSLDIPLIGVNHCIAHIEVGRRICNVTDPVILYVSGGNSQVLSYRAGKYRIFGETLDIGIGNALDKFGRYAGFQHPGGPKIEQLAKNAKKYVPLPYVVKGMDFSFSGLTTAAKDALEHASQEDVCYSFQETAFAMLVEVTERALAHIGKDDVLLVGGVGANERLKEMLGIMCKDRGARLYAPEKKFMRDNGVMIAHTGLLMLESGVTLPIEDSAVRPNYRPDDVDVVWI